jgi:excisionase family DNA binding protein
MNKEKLLTIAEVAEILKLKESTIRKKMRDNEIPGYKVGQIWRIKETDLLFFIEGCSLEKTSL